MIKTNPTQNTPNDFLRTPEGGGCLNSVGWRIFLVSRGHSGDAQGWGMLGAPIQEAAAGMVVGSSRKPFTASIQTLFPKPAGNINHCKYFGLEKLEPVLVKTQSPLMTAFILFYIICHKLIATMKNSPLQLAGRLSDAVFLLCFRYVCRGAG